MKEEIVKLLTIIAEQTGEQISGTRLALMVQDLCSIKPAECDLIGALHSIRRKARRFPTVDEILAEAGAAGQTSRDVGNEIASRIIVTLGKVGAELPSERAVAIRDAMLGEAALDIVRKLGGWLMVAEQAEENMTALRAQIRDLAESAARTGELKLDEPTPAADLSYGQALQTADALLELSAKKQKLLEFKHGKLTELRSLLLDGRISAEEAQAMANQVHNLDELPGETRLG